MALENTLSDFSARGYASLVARVCLSAVYLYSGITKLLDIPAGMAEVAGLGMPAPSLAGGGVWHGGGAGEPGRTRGFQLWIALPPTLELGPSHSLYLAPDTIQRNGPARVLLGSYGSAKSVVDAPSPINYLAVHLKKGEHWHYQPPTGHTVLWVAVGAGVVRAPNELHHGELVAFEPSNDPIELKAQSDAELVIGSAAPHDHDLVLGYYSVHTSPASLQTGERRIDEIKARLQKEGRL